MRRLLKIRVDGQQQRFVTVGQLFASHVKVESSGLFTCVSENKAGSESQSMHLYIHPKPQPGCEYLITVDFILYKVGHRAISAARYPAKFMSAKVYDLINCLLIKERDN